MTRLALAAAVLAVAAVPGKVSATPHALVHVSTQIAVTRVADSCGPGRSRDAAGRCHHRFNLFRHHDRFGAYKRKHCTPVHTPSGMVNRCNI